MKTLQEIKNNYAQEQGYEDWRKLRMTIQLYSELETHMDIICIRAQKAALGKAAENALIRLDYNNLNDNDGHSEKRFVIPNSPSYYLVDRTSITNPENLIR